MTVWDFIEKKNGKIVRTENYGSFMKMWKAENIVIENEITGNEIDHQKLGSFLRKNKQRFETKNFLIIKKTMI